MARYARTAMISAFIVALLALASYFTTGIFWVGAFPAGEYLINVHDPTDNPIPGAKLRIYHCGTSEPAFRFPFDNHRADQPLVSNVNGRVTAILSPSRAVFGGFSWRLFWLIPI